MANPVRLPITAASLSGGGPYYAPAQSLNFFASPFNVTIGVDISNATLGGATYSLQFTLDDIGGSYIAGQWDTTPGGVTLAQNPLWRADICGWGGTPAFWGGTPLTAVTASGIAFYQFPVQWVRLAFSGNAWTGTVYLEILQGMPQSTGF